MRLLLFCCCLLLGLPATLQAKPLVVASLKPLALFAAEYLGAAADVRTLLLPSQNPHQVNFTPQQLALLHQADLVLWLGAGAEPYLAPHLQGARLPALALLDQPGVQPLREAEAGHAGALDPHLWLDPIQLAALLPAMEKWAKKMNLSTSSAKRQELWQEKMAVMVRVRRQQLAPLARVGWLSYHDPWQYLQTRLELQPPLRVEEHPGAETSSRHFLELARAMQAGRVHCAVLEPEARKAVMEKLCRSPACRLEPIDPLARDSEAGSYTDWWLAVTGKLAQCLAGK